MGKKKGIFSALLGGAGGKKKSSSRASKARSKPSSSKGKSAASKSKSKTKTAPKSSAPKSKVQTKKPPMKATKNKNVSQRYPNGRTLSTKDEYLPIEKGKKSNNPKDERWVAVIDSNRKDELAVVRLTTQRQPNTTDLPTYKKGNKKGSFFKHFVEIEDNEGKPIKVDGKKFKENPKDLDLNERELFRVKNRVLDHCRQSSENKKKITDLKENGDLDG